MPRRGWFGRLPDLMQHNRQTPGEPLKVFVCGEDGQIVSHGRGAIEEDPIDGVRGRGAGVIHDRDRCGGAPGAVGRPDRHQPVISPVEPSGTPPQPIATRY
ncbi:MAG: hypothetical protein PHN82_08875 [bacterium]|nr:hypothetical protein [bacterium]